MEQKAHSDDDDIPALASFYPSEKYPFIMSDQQPTGNSWNAPVGDPPIFGAPSNVTAGGLINTPAGGLTKAPSGTTVGNFPAAGTPATTAGFTSTPIAPIPASTGAFATGNSHVAAPGKAYAPAEGPTNAPTGGLPHAFFIPAGSSLSIPLQSMPQLQQPSPYAASPSPGRAILPAPIMPTHVMVPSSQPLAPPPPPPLPAQNWYTSTTPARVATPLPAFTTMPQRLPSNLPEQPSFTQSTTPSPPPRRQPEPTPVDLSEEIPPPPPPRPVTQPYPCHPLIVDDSDILSKKSQRAIDWFSTEIGGRDLSRRFQGVVNPETTTSLDMTNDPVIFAHKFRSVFDALPSWALPLDQPGSGTQPSMPLRDERTPIRVAVLLRLLPELCVTRTAHKLRATVTVPTVDNCQIPRPAADLTATDLLRVFVHEFTEPGQSKITALAVRSQLHLLPGDSWMSAAHRTLMHTRAAHVQYYKPHAMEETYYWRTVTGGQLEDHCRRVIGVLNPSDTNPFEPILFNLRKSIRDDLNKRALSEGQLLEDHMVNRGIIAHNIYGRFLEDISDLSNLYTFPPAVHSQLNPQRPPPRGRSQRFSAVASNRHSRSPTPPVRDIFHVQSAVATSSASAFQAHPSAKGKRKRSFTERGTAIVNTFLDELSDDDPQESSSALPNEDAHQPSDVSHRHVDQDGDTQETADDLSAFANKPASRRGKFGTPFIDGSSSRPRRRPKPLPTTQFPSALGRKPATSTGTTTPTTATSTLPVPAMATTNTPSPQDILPTKDAHPQVVRRAIIRRRVCFYFAYGLSCPQNPCKYLHETSDIPYAWYRSAVSPNASRAVIAAMLHTEEAYGPQDYHDLD
ncbi:unnamed protein product [Ascophyllum nodosum]